MKDVERSKPVCISCVSCYPADPTCYSTAGINIIINAGGGGISTGAVVGIVVGAIAGLLLLALAVFWCMRRQRQGLQADTPPPDIKEAGVCLLPWRCVGVTTASSMHCCFLHQVFGAHCLQLQSHGGMIVCVMAVSRAVMCKLSQ